MDDTSSGQWWTQAVLINQPKVNIPTENLSMKTTLQHSFASNEESKMKEKNKPSLNEGKKRHIEQRR